MAVFASKDVASALLRKGFQEDNGYRRSVDHRWFTLVVDGKETGVHTKISRGNKPIDNYLIWAMSRQMCITAKDFADFVRCTLSREGYVEKLIQQGLVAREG